MARVPRLWFLRRSLPILGLALGVLVAQQPRPEPTIIGDLQRQTDSKGRLALVREWQRSYPKTRFQQERWQWQITAEQALGQGQAMLRTAEAMVRDDPQGNGLYWLTALAVALQDTSPAALRRGEHSARTLLQVLPKQFDDGKKPIAVPAAAWEEQRRHFAAVAHRTLGWVALVRQQWAVTERECTQALKLNLNDAEASYWLGTAILSQGQAQRQAVGLYHLARAAVVRGSDALTPAARFSVEKYLEQAFGRLPGARGELNRTYEQARAEAFPARDFRQR